jgi:predicted RNase H-like HicB family nuclease
MTKYAVVIERTAAGYRAYVPDLPGCSAVAANRDELDQLIAEAITLHIESLREHGETVPHPSAEIEYIQPAARD